MLNIIRYFIKKPKVVNLIIIFVLMAGALSLFFTKKEGYPSIDFGEVSITTVYHGASPKDIELKITNKIEEKLKGISGVKEIKSWSIENFSNINIQMEDNADVQKVYEDIQNAVNQVDDLPDDAKKPVVTLADIDIIPIMEIAVTGNCDYREKRKYAEILEKKIRRNKYVGSVSKVGYLKREIKVEVSQKELIKNYVSLGELMTAISNQNFRMSTGDLITENEKKLVVMSEFNKLEDVKNVIVRSSYDGKIVRVSDVAIIKDEFEKPDKIITYNGDEAINLIITKKSKEDIVRATKSINNILNDFRGNLPENLKIEMIVDYSSETKNLLKLVIDNAWFGFILVIIVLVLMLNYRLAFWTSIGIPTSILLAFMLFPVFDININFISLMAIIIVLGMLVDDAIIIGENIYRYREEGIPADKAAFIGVKEVMWPVISTVLTTVIVFMPMIGMTGIMGKFMRTMPIVVMLMLFASLVEALFLLPTHVAHMKMKQKKTKAMQIFHKIEEKYEKFVAFTLRNKGKTILLFFIMFVIAVILPMTPFMKFMLFPSDDGLYGYIQFETEKGTSLEVTAQKVKEIEKVVSTMSKKEVRGFVTTSGQKMPWIVNFDEGSISSGFMGNIVIYLTPMSKRKRTLTQIMDELKLKLKNVEGFKKLEADIVTDGPPVGKPVTVTFISNNDEQRNKIVAEFKEYLRKHNGVSNIEDNQGEGKKRLIISFDYNLLSRLGLDPLNVSTIIRAAFEGSVVTSLKWEGEDVDYRIILNKESREDIKTLTSLTIQNLKSLTIQNKYGKLIPLGKFIKLEEADDIMMINHYDGDKSITVYSDLDTKVITSPKMNKLIREEFEPKIKDYPGMEVVYGGEEQDTQESMNSLFLAFILAIVGVYFILVILFNSFSQPILVMLTIPFGFSGVVFAFFIHQIPFSFVAMIGMIGLTGVVVNDSLVMITFLNNERKKNGISIHGLAKAAKHRLRPIVLTTSTTAAGLFPSAYGFGGDNPFIIPMIMAIAWGLVFATVITLILIPSLYLSLAKINMMVKNFFNKEKYTAVTENK